MCKFFVIVFAQRDVTSAARFPLARMRSERGYDGKREIGGFVVCLAQAKHLEHLECSRQPHIQGR